jgi:hypothetical protein
VNSEFIFKSDNDISGDNLLSYDENETTSNSDRLANNKLQGVGDKREGIRQDPIGYEQLWQLRTSSGNLEDNISEVTENDDILDDLPETEVDQAIDNSIANDDTLIEDGREMYANTSVFMSASGTVDVELPPPLPPRLPSTRQHQDPRSPSQGSSQVSSKCASQSELSRASASQSDLSNRIGTSQSGQHENGFSRQLTSFGRGPDFDSFSGEAVDCSSPNPSLQQQNSNRSCVSSTPKDIPNQSSEPKTLPEKGQQLKALREDLLSRLQSEEQERRWYYSQLQLIAQKISSIPPTSPNSVCFFLYNLSSLWLENLKFM